MRSPFLHRVYPQIHSNKTRRQDIIHQNVRLRGAIIFSIPYLVAPKLQAKYSTIGVTRYVNQWCYGFIGFIALTWSVQSWFWTSVMRIVVWKDVCVLIVGNHFVSGVRFHGMLVIPVNQMVRQEMKTMWLLVLLVRRKGGRGVPSVGILLSLLLVATLLHADLLSFLYYTHNNKLTFNQVLNHGLFVKMNHWHI